MASAVNLYRRIRLHIRNCPLRQAKHLRAAARRPATAGALFLSYAGIVVVLAFAVVTSAHRTGDIKVEAHHREADICRVIINLHQNAQFRAKAEHNRLDGTLSYLEDHKSDNSDLVRRVRAALPNTRADVLAADQSVAATAVPPTCRPQATR